MESIYLRDRADGNWYELKDKEPYYRHLENIAANKGEGLSYGIFSTVVCLASLGGCWLGISEWNCGSTMTKIVNLNNSILVGILGMGMLKLVIDQVYHLKMRYNAKKLLGNEIQELVQTTKSQNTFSEVFQQVYPPKNTQGIQFSINSLAPTRSKDLAGQPLLVDQPKDTLGAWV